jgi:hypothetical protein
MRTSAAAVTVIAAALAAAAACSPEYARTPPELRGIWTTDARGYEGRYLTIEGTTVVFGVRRVQSLRHTVREVEKVDARRGHGYDLTCTGPNGDEIILHLALDERHEDILYVRHRPKVSWTREEGDG